MKVLKLQKSESLTLNIPVIITGKQTNVICTWASEKRTSPPHQQWLIWYILAIINENVHKSYVFTPARVTLCKHSQAQATIGILVKHKKNSCSSNKWSLNSTFLN